MSNGLLANVNMSASVVTTIYTVPSGTIASFSINVSNYNQGASCRVKLYVDDSATSIPVLSALLEPGIWLPASSVYERVGMVLGPGQVLQAYTDYTSCVAVQVYGFEESAS